MRKDGGWQLSFSRQLVLGFVVLGLGFLLANATRQGIFLNLSGMVYGALFLFHPVVPKGAGNPIRLETLERVVGAALMLLSMAMNYSL